MKKLNTIIKNKKVKKAATLTAALLFTCGAVITPATDVQAEELNGMITKDGKMYWYENGTLQGLEGRGKEIYDPSSDAWYWLDSVQGGAVAKAKDVYQESWAGSYGDNGEYGKWVRYDENGHMVKGEDYRYGGWYRFDEITGAMIKGLYTAKDGKTYYYNEITGQMEHGTVVINGEDYVFDYVTGAALDGVWLNIDGNDYWYENGKRQGTEGRGKEIYDPSTDAWYWLDAVDGGKKATAKDVYQEDGNKWVRYDENGKMIKGWNAYGNLGVTTFVIDEVTGAPRYDYDPTDKDGDMYYFDLQTGAMVKGTVDIDGITYTFDDVTGVLDMECLKKQGSGRLYCIEADAKSKAERLKGSNQMDEETYNALVTACENGEADYDYYNLNGYAARFCTSFTYDGVEAITPNGKHGYPYVLATSYLDADEWRFFHSIVTYDAETDKTKVEIYFVV